MKKEIRIISLLNKSANRESLPNKIKYKGRIYFLYRAYGSYFVEGHPGEDNFRFLHNRNVQHYAVLNNYVEIIEDILDTKEKEYLSNVIRPFRDRVEYIKKNTLLNGKKEAIIINYTDNCYPNEIYFPSFEKGTMYKNMELNKEYTPDELGI